MVKVSSYEPKQMYCSQKTFPFMNKTWEKNGIRTIAPGGKFPPVRVGVCVKLGLVLGLGAARQLPLGQNCPPA